jgi:hypothetical protein
MTDNGLVQRLNDIDADPTQLGDAIVSGLRKFDFPLRKLAGRRASDQNDAIGKQKRFVDVVRDQNGGGTEVAHDSKQKPLHVRARNFIESAEGFVQQQHLRLAREAAGKCRPLRHSPR